MLRVEESGGCAVRGGVATVVKVGQALGSVKSVTFVASADAVDEFRVRSVSTSVAEVLEWYTFTDALITNN